MCKKCVLLGLLLSLCSVILTGCGKQQNTEPVTSQTQESAQVVEESVSMPETEEVEETTELPSTEPEESIQNANIDKLLGQWKVTEHVLTDNGRLPPDYWFAEHFVGRSIIIDNNTIFHSLHYWPNGVYSIEKTYEDVRKEYEHTDEYGRRNSFRDFWYSDIPDQMLEVYTFHGTYSYLYKMEEFVTDFDEEYIVLEDGKVLCNYLGSYYYMEPYVEAETRLDLEQLFGNWRVERLISYQESWRGNNEYVASVTLLDNDTIFTEEEGGNFSPLDYYNASFSITEDSVTLCLEDGTTEQYAIHLFGSQTVDTASYEEEKGIHDRLGVTNEDILVYTANIDGKTDEMLWNGDIIVIDENRIIVKLYQGWYMLVRE